MKIYILKVFLLIFLLSSSHIQMTCNKILDTRAETKRLNSSQKSNSLLFRQLTRNKGVFKKLLKFLKGNENDISLKDFLVTKAWLLVKTLYKEIKTNKGKVTKYLNSPVSSIVEALKKDKKEFSDPNKKLDLKTLTEPEKETTAAAKAPKKEIDETKFKYVFEVLDQVADQGTDSFIEGFVTPIVDMLSPFGFLTSEEDDDGKKTEVKDTNEKVKDAATTALTDAADELRSGFSDSLVEELQKCLKPQSSKIKTALKSVLADMKAKVTDYKSIYQKLKKGGIEVAKGIFDTVKKFVVSLVQTAKGVLVFVKDVLKCFATSYLPAVAASAKIVTFTTVLTKFLDKIVNLVPVWSQIKGVIFSFFNIFKYFEIFEQILEKVDIIKAKIKAQTSQPALPNKSTQVALTPKDAAAAAEANIKAIEDKVVAALVTQSKAFGGFIGDFIVTSIQSIGNLLNITGISNLINDIVFVSSVIYAKITSKKGKNIKKVEELEMVDLSKEQPTTTAVEFKYAPKKASFELADLSVKIEFVKPKQNAGDLDDVSDPELEEIEENLSKITKVV